MRTLRKQRGFLLNPYRFEGTVQSGAFNATGEGVLTVVGAGIASAVASASGVASLIADSDQASSGAFSASGAAATTLVGAAIAEGAASAAGEAGLTVNGTSGEATVDAADFDGSNDVLKRGANLTGITNSKKGILSAWIRVDSTSFGVIFLGKLNSTTAKIFFAMNSAAFNFSIARVSDATSIFSLNSNSGKSADVWYHVLMSWDREADTGKCYVNDADETNYSSGVDESAPYESMIDWHLAAHVNDSLKLDGCVAEFYFAPGQYLDLSVEENRRKFISADGKPVALGPTGSTPTGTDPRVYFHLEDGETVSNFAVNRGTGGNFTITGSLDTCATSPSD